MNHFKMKDPQENQIQRRASWATEDKSSDLEGNNLNSASECMNLPMGNRKGVALETVTQDICVTVPNATP